MNGEGEFCKFAVSRRRHDERYWDAIWSKSDGSCTKAAELSGMSRRLVREHLERLGIRARKHARPMLTPIQVITRLSGHGVFLDTHERLDNHQRIAVEIWLAALDSDTATHYDRVTPGFLLTMETTRRRDEVNEDGR